MKKTILLSSIFALGAAFATEVTSGNAIGALDKAISTTDAEQVLIAVPFLGYNGDAVAVQDMVKTSNLADGSKLYVPTPSGVYNTWKLQDNQWVADNQVTVGSNGQPSAYEGEGAEETSISRGDSFWLEPKFKSGTSGTVFLLGQAATGAGTSTAEAGWNLIGNASVTTKALNVTGTQGDMIVVQVNGKLRYYKYSTSKGWRYQDESDGEYKPENPSIAPGQGLWYYNKGTSSLAINW